MNTCIKTGAVVQLPDYNLTAMADLFAVGDARIIRFTDDPRQIGHHGAGFPRPVTHRLYLNNRPNWWRPDLGTAVVHESDLQAVDGKED